MPASVKASESAEKPLLSLLRALRERRKNLIKLGVLSGLCGRKMTFSAVSSENPQK